LLIFKGQNVVNHKVFCFSIWWNFAIHQL